MSGPFSRVIDAVAAIATKLGATVASTGNRLADNLEGIADKINGSSSGGAGSIIVHYTVEGDGDDGVIITIEEDWEDIAAVGEAGGLIIAQKEDGSSDATYFARYYPAGEEDGETFPAGIYWVEQAFAGFGDGMQFLDVTYGYASTGESYYEEQHWYVETYDPTNP